MQETDALARKHPHNVGRDVSSQGGKAFVMYTMPANAFLQMTEVRTHEELADACVLAEFDERLGKAMFVSHQWLSN